MTDNRDPHRSFRIPDELWARLNLHAQVRGESTSEVLRRAVTVLLDNEPATPNGLLTVAEAATACGVSISTVNNWVRDELLPVASESPVRRFSATEVDKAARLAQRVRKPGRPRQSFDYDWSVQASLNK